MKSILAFALNLAVVSTTLFAFSISANAGDTNNDSEMRLGENRVWVKNLFQQEAQEKLQFSFVKSIELDGKTYEAYVTQNGDVILAGQTQTPSQNPALLNNLETKEQEKERKEQEKERTNKHGVFLPWMTKARSALSKEALFSFGFAMFGNMGYKSWDSAQVALHREGVIAQPVADGWKLQGEEDLVTASAQLKANYRPHFYRHLRAAVDAEFFASGDDSGTQHGPIGFGIAVDHDVVAFPVNTENRYFAIAAGYFASQHTMQYSLSREISRGNSEYQTIKVPFRDHGYTVSMRVVNSDSHNTGQKRGPTMTVQILAEWGKNGGRRIQGMYLYGF